jgi:hypothetical protein
MLAHYCLKTQPAQWDFAHFIVLIKSININHVIFFNLENIQINKYVYCSNPKEIALNRFHKIVLPLCNLANVTYEIKNYDIKEKKLIWALQENACYFYKVNKYLWKFNSVKEKSNYVTFTIRNSIRNKFRDSSQSWKEFAKILADKKINVKIILDNELNSITVEERFKLYSKAIMNYTVGNGPAALLYYSDMPYKLWIKGINPGNYNENLAKLWSSFKRDENFPFAEANQNLIWEEDTLESLLKNI